MQTQKIKRDITDKRRISDFLFTTKAKEHLSCCTLCRVDKWKYWGTYLCEQWMNIYNYRKARDIKPKKSDRLYVFEANWIYKVWVTWNINKRLSTTITHNPSVSLVHNFYCENARWMEKAIHSIYKDKRILWEWFSLTKKDVDHIENLFSWII